MIRQDIEMYRKWPKPSLEGECKSSFLFILTLPRSGSTVLAQTLRNLKGWVMLNEKGEGQWLVRGLCQRDRWDPDKEVDWDSVARTWKKRIKFIEELTGESSVVIEKSPPNIVRINKMLKCFDRKKVISLVRNPYGYCYSYAKRQSEYKKDRVNRKVFEKAAEDWVSKSRTLAQKENEFSQYRVNYEEFCSDTIEEIREILRKTKYNTEKRVDELKNIETSNIREKNSKAHKKIKKQEKERVYEVISNSKDLVNHLGYSCSPRK